MVKIEVKLTPNEFRKTLPKKLQEFFDGVVTNLVEMGYSEKEAKVIVAQELLEALKRGSE